MILAAHQPNLLPWLGYFHKMLKADLFVIVDHVQFERQGFQNRTRVKTGEGPMWITVPVRQASRDERVIDKLVDNTGRGYHRWSHRIGTTIKLGYQGAPYYAEYVRPIIEVLDGPWEKLTDLNVKLIELCCQALAIKTPILRSSDLNITGYKSDMVLNLCQQVGASVYLTGSGGSKDYLNRADFEMAGIQIQWQEFTHPIYPQHPARRKFVEKMSVIDLLANCGPQSRAILEGVGQQEKGDVLCRQMLADRQRSFSSSDS